jgi:4'-phosphopantetheinyl transferase
MRSSRPCSEPALLGCQVLIADTGWLRPEHRSLLTPVERSRAEAFVRGEDRARFLVGAALARLALGKELGVHPADVGIDRRCPHCGDQHGKPQVSGAGVHFSISHSATMVALAVTRAAPVGVDVEKRNDRRWAGLARHILASSEPLSRTADLSTYWCRKESVIKATGEGLHVPLPQVVVSPADAAPGLLSYRDGPLTATMEDLPLGPDFAGAVTVLTTPVRVDVGTAEELLRA